MAKLPRSIAIQLQSFQPAVSEYLLQPEELQLRQRMRGLEKLQEPYRPELTGCSCASGPVLDLVARERLPGVFHAEGIATEPQRDVCLCETFISEDPPVHQTRIPQSVEDADVACLEEGALEVLGMAEHTGAETQHRLRAFAAIFAVPVGPVSLGVVVGHPSLVCVHQLLPALCSRKVVVRHLPLDVECGFDGTLPRLAFLDLYLVYVQGFVDLLCPVSEEDAAGVRDERLRRAVALDGRVEDRQKRVEVLLWADGTGENHPAVVFEDRDHVKVAFER